MNDPFEIYDDTPLPPEPASERWRNVRCAQCGEWVTFPPTPFDLWVGSRRLCRMCLDVMFGIDRAASAETRKHNQAAFDACFDGKET